MSYVVFPVEPGGKRPLVAKWQETATDDPARIAAWEQEFPGCNWGIVCGRSGLIVVDIDPDKGGTETWEAWELSYGAVETYEVQTPSGGRHLYFQGEGPTGANVCGPGVDTRGGSLGGAGQGYVLAPGSHVGGKPYLAGAATAPVAWPYAPLRTPRREAIRLQEAVEEPASRERLNALIETAPPGVEGGRNEATYRLACRVADLGYGLETALEALADWNDCQEPPLEPEEFAVAVRQGYVSRQNTVGVFAVNTDANEAWAEYLTQRDAAPRDERTLRTLEEVEAGVWPPVEMALDGFVVRGAVNVLFGPGAAGKTLAAQQMGMAVAAGVPCWGRDTLQGPVLMLAGEDPEAVIQHRARAIRRQLGIDPERPLPFQVWCLPDDPRLAQITEEGAIFPLPFLAEMDAELERRPGALVILDSAADVFDLDENAKAPVYAALKRVLWPRCKRWGATFILIAHPSRTGMKDGSGIGGSTAWLNAVRNVLSLDHKAGDDQRTLRNLKFNYGRTQEVSLTWHEGAMIRSEEADTRPKLARAEAAYELVLAECVGLIKRGVRVVQTHGTGQKPKDLSEALKARGHDFSPELVLDCLQAAERRGALVYLHGGKTNRGQRAGYCLPEEAEEFA